MTAPPMCDECPEERSDIRVGDAVVICGEHGKVVKAKLGQPPFDSWKGPPPSAERGDE